MSWLRPAKPESPTDVQIREYLDIAEALSPQAWTDSAPRHIVCRLPAGNYLHLELVAPQDPEPTVKLSVSSFRGQPPIPPLETTRPQLLQRTQALITKIEKDVDFADSPQIRGGRWL